jgi:hypothetical protein
VANYVAVLGAVGNGHGGSLAVIKLDPVLDEGGPLTVCGEGRALDCQVVGAFDPCRRHEDPCGAVRAGHCQRRQRLAAAVAVPVRAYLVALLDWRDAFLCLVPCGTRTRSTSPAGPKTRSNINGRLSSAIGSSPAQSRPRG